MKILKWFRRRPHLCDLPKEERMRARYLMWGAGSGAQIKSFDGFIHTHDTNAGAEQDNQQDQDGKPEQ